MLDVDTISSLDHEGDAIVMEVTYCASLFTHMLSYLANLWSYGMESVLIKRMSCHYES